jgi:plastocyanin
MRARLSVLVAIAGAVVAAVAAPAAGAATAEVGIADFRFSPAYTLVAAGDSVHWTQRGSVHTVTSRAGAPQSFDSGDLGTGEQFTRVFAVAGRYAYHCTIHPEMRGVVQVGPDTTPPKPAKLRLRPGSKALRVSFRLPEAAQVTARVTRKGKPGKALRTVKRRFEDGGRALAVPIAGLEPGRYRVGLRARDRAGNVAGVTGGFRIADAG